MDVTITHRNDAEAEGASQDINGLLRLELLQTADDGTQYHIMLLDADDSFDIVVTRIHPRAEAGECVYSLTRERVLRDE